MASEKETRIISVEFQTSGYDNVIGKLNKLDNEQNKFTRKQKKMLNLERGFLKERYRRSLGLKTFNGNYDATVSQIDNRTNRQKFVDDMSKKFRQERALRKFGAKLVNLDDYDTQFGPRELPGLRETTYNKWLASRFEREKAYRESKKVGRAGIFKHKTKDYIDSNIVGSRSDELSKMADYYKKLEVESKRIADNEAKATAEVAKRRRLADKQMRQLRERGSASMRKYNARKAKEASIAIANRQTTLRGGLKSLDKAREKFLGLTNTITQAVGELTMFAGAITMVSYMATSAFGKMMKVGEAFANVEKTYLVGAGFRERLYQQGGVKSLGEFDSAISKATKFTGKSTFQTAEMLARTGSTIKDAGGKVTMRNLMNVVESAYGLSAITGGEPDKMIEKILKESGKGTKGDTGKLGIKSLKLTKNMDANLEIIAKTVKENPIGFTAINKGSIEANINRVKSAPNELMSRVYGFHMNQTKSIFSKIDDVIWNTFTDKDVVKAWSRTLSNFEDDVNEVFDEKRFKNSAINAAKMAARISELGKNILKGALWAIDNYDTIEDGAIKIGKIWLGIQAFKVTSSTIKMLGESSKAIKALGALFVATETATATAGAATGAATLGGSLVAVGTGLVALAGGIAAIWTGGKLGKFLGEKTVGLKNDYYSVNEGPNRAENFRNVLLKYTKDGKFGLDEDFILNSFVKNDGFNFSGKGKEFSDARLAYGSKDLAKKQDALDKMLNIIDEEIKARDKYAKENSAINSAVMESLVKNKAEEYLKNKSAQHSKDFANKGYNGGSGYGFINQSFLNPNATVLLLNGDIRLSENVSYQELNLMNTAGGAVN